MIFCVGGCLKSFLHQIMFGIFPHPNPSPEGEGLKVSLRATVAPFSGEGDLEGEENMCEIIFSAFFLLRHSNFLNLS